MRAIGRALIILFAFLPCAESEAELKLVLEPNIGYSEASTLVTSNPLLGSPGLAPSNATAQFALTSLELGLRLGGEFKPSGIMFGGEYLTATLSGSGIGELAGENPIARKLKVSGYGVFLGDHIPGTPLRLWATYFLNLSFSDSGAYNAGGSEAGKAGYKIGVGILPNQYTSLSLEYLDAQLTRSNATYQGYTYTYGDEDFRMVTISLGFTLGSWLD